MSQLTSSQPNFDEIMQTSREAKALADFILEFPNTDRAVSTSWTCYSMTPTTEETLMHDMYSKLGVEDNFPQTHLTDMHDICHALMNHHHTDDENFFPAVVEFMKSLVDDYITCFAQEDCVAYETFANVTYADTVA